MTQLPHPKYPICPEQFFFWKNHRYNFIYLFTPFILQNLKAILKVNPQLWGCAIFVSKMPHLPPKSFFSRKTIIIIFMHFLVPFIIPNSELWGSAIFGLRWPNCPFPYFFFKNPWLNTVPFTCTYLHTINQHKMLIYWWNTDLQIKLISHWPECKSTISTFNLDQSKVMT